MAKEPHREQKEKDRIGDIKHPSFILVKLGQIKENVVSMTFSSIAISFGTVRTVLDCETGREDGMIQKAGWMAHLLQLVQNALIYTILFQIDPRRLDDVRNDLLVDVAHSRIRHLGRELKRKSRVFRDMWCCKLRCRERPFLFFTKSALPPVPCAWGLRCSSGDFISRTRQAKYRRCRTCEDKLRANSRLVRSAVSGEEVRVPIWVGWLKPLEIPFLPGTPRSQDSRPW